MAAVYLVAVRTPLGQMIDTAVMTEIAAALSGARWTQTVLDVISPFTLVLATLAVAALGRAAAARAVGAVAITAGGAQLLKASLARPEWFDTMGNSWPSGHVAAVAGLTVGSVLAARLALRRTITLVGGVLVTITGVATLAQQWHRPSDVVASVLLAVAVGLVIQSST